MPLKYYQILLTIAWLIVVANALDRADRKSKLFKNVEKEKVAATKPRTGQERIFSLFSIVTFKNSGCSSNSGTTGTSNRNRNGTCYTSTECSDKSGQASGNCAAGFGVCCLFIVTAGSSTISENCTYLQNPSFPSVYSSTSGLTYTIAKCATDVCSLRFDFETFTLVGPANTAENTGVCTDTFQVTGGAGKTTPVICGKNSGEHIYYDIGTGTSDTATVTFAFATTTSTVRTWEIKVTQIECSSLARPFDPGCLQYHTGTTGRISTFNFQETTTGSIAHLANQDYTICIRADAGNCCIAYTKCTDSNSWTIDIAASPAQARADTDCTEDFVGISGVMDFCSQSTSAVMHSKLCGNILNTARAALLETNEVCDCTEPFTIDIETDATTDTIAPTAPAPSRGICLNYRQEACSNLG